MKRIPKVFIAFLLSFTMIFTMGTAGITGTVSEKENEAKQEEKVEDLVEEAPEEPVKEDPVEPVKEDPVEPVKEPSAEPVKEPSTEPGKEPSADQGEEPPADQGEEPPVDQGEEPPADQGEETSADQGKETSADSEEPVITTLTVSHILDKEDGSTESLGTSTSEYSVGTVISLGSLSLGGETYIYSGSSSDEITITEGSNSTTLSYTIRKEAVDQEEEIEIEIEKANLVVTHILLKKDREEKIGVSNIEDLEVGSIISKESLKLNDDDLIYLGNSLEEITISSGTNETTLYYEPVIVYTDLTINHILRSEYQEELGMTEVIEQLEVGSIVYSSDYIYNHENINFLESDVSELSLIEGINIIDLYYEFSIEDEFTSEDPDFTVDEAREIDTPYIEEFKMGSLGPFEEINLQDVKGLRLMRSESYPDEINNKEWPEAGSLKVNKTGEPIEGSGNKWEITLELEGKDNVETSDIVLVLDRSGSMNGKKINDARDAAKDFVSTLLADPNKTHVRIALVSFAGHTNLDSEFKDSQEKDLLLSAIDEIYAHGGTHIQAGLKQANELLNGSQADYKNIVLLGDGAATYSFGINNPNSYLEHWYDSGSGWWIDPIIKRYRTTSNIQKGSFNYDETVGDGSGEYYEYEENFRIRGLRFFLDRNYYRHGASTIAEAGFAKSAGNDIYTIALDAGEEGNWTLEGVASPDNYYETLSSDDLDKIFEEIAGRITKASREAIVTDPLGDKYSILGINASNYNDLIEVSEGTTVTYDTTNNTISWDIGDVDEGEEYWMKYKVALDYSAEGGVLYPTNKATYIDYLNIDDKVAKKYFPIPEFSLRALTLSKTVTNESDNEEFDIILEGPVGPYSKTWAVSLRDGESEDIKGLLPGSYTIKETVPMNYGAVNTMNLEIGEDDWVLSSNITNTKNNDGWFYDGDELINTFKVGKVDNDSNSASKKTDFEYAKLDYFIIPSSVEKSYKANGET